MEPKRPGLPSAQPEYTTRQAGGALEQRRWSKEGGHRGGRHEKGRAGLPGWVHQGPPLCYGSHQTLHFNQRHSAHCSRVPQASVQLLTRCPGIFWAFIKLHHA